jgi:cytosine/uracil/thiamine/allantoin permease
VRHGRFAITEFFNPAGIYGRWGSKGITSYLVGILVEIPFMYIPGVYESPGAKALQGVDVSWVLGLFVGGGLYFLLTRGLNRDAERVAIERSERELANPS